MPSEDLGRQETARRKRSIFRHDFAQIERDIDHYLDGSDTTYIHESLSDLKQRISYAIHKEETKDESEAPGIGDS